MSARALTQLSLAPLGAGDLIDRAVRLYRRHFFTLIRIAAPPIIVAAAGAVLFAVAWRKVFTTSEDTSLALYILVLLAGVLLVFAGNVFSLVVMGGATRNLVTHLLWNEPVSAGATYAAVRSRFAGLLVASLLVMVWLVFATFVTIFAWYMVFAFVMFGSIMLAMVASWLAVVIGVTGGVAASVLGLWLFFFLAGRVAYVPQAMLVEGKGVFDALGRSFSLARGSVRRLMAMAIFTSFASWSALMILIAPLGWFAYINGVDLSPFAQAESPAWYAIGYNVIGEISKLLLAPVWMLGLSLLYLDERVRHEAYDVELMAARQLPEMPRINVASPLAPAISTAGRRTPPPPPPMSTGRVLGLS